MFRKITFLVVVIMLASASALAQSVEITPTVGYRFGGDFDDVGSATDHGSASLEDSETFGITADFLTREGWGVELLWSGSSTELSVSDTLGFARQPRARTSTFQMGGIYHFRNHTSTQPFVVATLGTTQLKVEGRSQNSFAYAAGGGVKFYFAEHFGARLQGSITNAHYTTDEEFVCNETTCYGLTDENPVLQFEATAGFIFKF